MEHCETIALNAASLLIRAEENPVFGFELMKRVSMQLIHRLQAFWDRFVGLNEQNTGNNRQVACAGEAVMAV